MQKSLTQQILLQEQLWGGIRVLRRTNVPPDDIKYAVCLSRTALVQDTNVPRCPSFISNRSTAVSKSRPASAGDRFATVVSMSL